MTKLDELRMITRIAQMYFIDGQRQLEIARHFRISQTTVSRILKRAEEEEIVRTVIVSPLGIYSELENSLREKFGLSEVIVVECSRNQTREIMTRIGEAAAHYVSETITQGEVIGVSSWSETILKMVDNIYPTKTRKAKFVVQTLGGMGDPTVQIHANQLTTRLAKLTGAEARLLTAPGVAQSREAKLVLIRDSYICETMELFNKISLMVIGIGAVEPSSMLARSGNVFSPRELEEIRNVGGVGDLSLRFFNKLGKLVTTPLDERVIGITLDELTKVDRVLGLAGGKSKINAIFGALNTGVLDILITDKFTAQSLIQVNG